MQPLDLGDVCAFDIQNGHVRAEPWNRRMHFPEGIRHLHRGEMVAQYAGKCLGDTRLALVDNDG